MGLDLIRASNGNGEAVRASVTQIRAVGSTTLNVDALTHWPESFIATSGRIQADGSLDPSSVSVFSGHITGSAITIDEFAPGYEDAGNSVGEVVIVKPSTMWADTLHDILSNSLDNNGNIKSIDGGELGIKFAISATEPTPDPDAIIIWFEPLE